MGLQLSNRNLSYTLTRQDGRHRVSCGCSVSESQVVQRNLNSICSLFDMDGTLVDSTAGVIGAWETFADTYPGLDVEKILSSE